MISSIWYAIVMGSLFGSGVYLLLRGNVARVLLGVLLISHAVNLALFVSPEIGPRRAPIVPPALDTLPGTITADPLPQALILTAIVIGFGVLAFLLVLVQQAYRATGSDAMDELTREHNRSKEEAR